VTEGVVDVESGLVELYTMIMMLPKLPLYAESALTTAKVIHLLQFPGESYQCEDVVTDHS